MPELYRRASVTVLPSDHEVFGLVVLESQASGTPAVVLDNEYGPAQLVSDDTGVCCDRDAESLANACLSAIDLSALPGTPARCREAAARFDWDTAITPRVVELYQGAVSPAPMAK
jgi:glycosyltransferase involved in cell wall biosynthesis